MKIVESGVFSGSFRESAGRQPFGERAWDDENDTVAIYNSVIWVKESV